MPTGQTDGDNSLVEILSSQTTSRFMSGWWKWISILGEAKSTSFPQTVRGHLGLEILTSGPVRLLLGLATQFMETKPPSNETPLMVPSKPPLRSQVTHPKTARDSPAMLVGVEGNKGKPGTQASSKEPYLNPGSSGTHSADTVAGEVKGSLEYKNLRPAWATQKD